MSLEHAKSLRKQMTDAERRLWYRLRAHRLENWKFKRQVPIGPYVVDFASLNTKTVIEVDGGQHQGNKRDTVRDHYLVGLGYVVLRFWNDEVLRSTDAVLEQITSTIREASNAPSPGSARRAEPPSPRRGEGK